MIEASGLEKSYGNLKVLKGVNLTIKKGEIISIVGASGAGKSTLLHILGTLDQPDAGSLKINNTDVFKLKSKALSKFRNSEIGFIFQFHHLLPEFTALENVLIPAMIGGKNMTETKNRALEFLDVLGVAHRKEHKPAELSGGEQQRVAVCRALINSPSVIFADEPSGNLDSNSSKELHKLFFDLREKFDQTFVIVTHNQELANMADRKLEIIDGII